MYNDRRLARTRSCPTLFAVLKEQMVQGKKIRLSRGTLNYIKSKKAGKFYKSTSSSELETILEGDEGDNYTDDDTLSSCSVSSSHSEPADMSDVACSTTAEAPSAYTLEHRLPGSLRISPRRLNQWSDSVVIQRYIPLGQKNSNTFRNVAENSSHGHSLYPVQSEKNSSSVYKDKNAPQHNSYISSLLDSSNLSFLNKESKSRKDEKQDSVPKREQSETSNETYGNRRNMDIIHPGQLWLPPVEWRVENMESLVWKDQHIYHKEEGGWWMERWTLRTESRQKLGDKFGVDADGTPWSEWWLETELPNSNTNTCAAYIKKFGQKWGRNAKGERWYETWQVKNDGKVETTYRLERAKSGNF
ncbi:uncharacterized protein Gasu_42220 [Galdieria sulphuraria]|uniref:Uncharacterized protein n=1 Tax=Galdieria sulphuraria TaxID=130081 RepID=M2XDZ2_GALSU|nr:uncharacterized protein Gasu_42220 [Galdieria sulphuraria]EME28217.1 hypothetical protein Gasu_42220 [Galdieria sulphuraria]|eukprot:XP_005704737.1 hypothetical protein Gasu_42220 [Galdieria sulphuraria]